MNNGSDAALRNPGRMGHEGPAFHIPPSGLTCYRLFVMRKRNSRHCEHSEAIQVRRTRERRPIRPRWPHPWIAASVFALLAMTKSKKARHCERSEAIKVRRTREQRPTPRPSSQPQPTHTTRKTSNRPNKNSLFPPSRDTFNL